MMASRTNAATIDPDTTQGIWMPGEGSLGGVETTVGATLLGWEITFDIKIGIAVVVTKPSIVLLGMGILAAGITLIWAWRSQSMYKTLCLCAILNPHPHPHPCTSYIATYLGCDWQAGIQTRSDKVSIFDANFCCWHKNVAIIAQLCKAVIHSQDVWLM